MADPDPKPAELPVSDDADPDVPTNRKAFVPLENNPEVMTTLVRKLGLSPSLAFTDVFSIDDADLLAFVPRPALALLLVFPVSETYESFRREEDAGRDAYVGAGADEPVTWFKQTIRNACGLIGLLHSVANGEARNSVEPDTPLAKLLADATTLAPAARADLLYNSPALESAHQAAAAEGNSEAPSADAKVDLHYVSFIKGARDGHLWELDGRRTGPLDRGPLGADDDVLSEAALALGVRKFLAREEQAGKGELRFSLVVLGPSME
ncbi:MAG: ubiquitinyl hydrolase 1 [Thelocarpon impressellum]|nr:MAG: ubiquitinyl hydrolase 1 [Thelocarpon impressellum]